MEQVFVYLFNKFVRTNNSLNEAWALLTEDFCENILLKPPMTESTMKTLEKCKKQVAWLQVKAEDAVVSRGTCFLLTESLALTCYHVVKGVFVSPGRRIEISFDYSQNNMEPCYLPAEVVTYSERYNYAFLRVTSPIPRRPGGLLQYVAPPPQDGAVAIIGHPQGQCKQIDMCSVINVYNNEDLIYPPFVHVLTRYNCVKVLYYESEPNNLSTCLHDGASGAPVFNERGELVAMHSGGYTVDAPNGAERDIEYGRSMVEIIIMGALEIEDLHCQFLEFVKRNETLIKYMSSDSHDPHMKSFITGLITLGKLEGKQMVLTMESPRITRTMRVQGYPKWRPKNESENKKEKDEPESLTFKMTLSLEFTINPEDPRCDMLKQHITSMSHLTFNLSRLLSPNLYNRTSTEPSGLENPGSKKCGKCSACGYMKEGATFSSYRTRETHNICQHMDCNSTHVIYLISCTKCKLQYVGMTTGELKERISHHRADASNPQSTSPSMVSKHFLTVHEGDVSGFQFQGIQKIDISQAEEIRKGLLLNEEAYWIEKLDTLYPSGLNLKSDFVHQF